MKRLLVILLAMLFSFAVISCDSNGDDKKDDDVVDVDEDVVDPCDPDPCGSNEECIEDEDAEKGYVCECVTGYEWDADEEKCVEEETPEVCVIDKTIINATYDNYFAFEGTGPINPANRPADVRPEGTMMSNLKIQLGEYPNKAFAQAFSWFQDDPTNANGPSIMLIALGDPVGQMYSTYVQTSIPLAWIDIFKESGEAGQEIQPFSTMAQVYNLRDLGNDITEICILGVSAFAEIDGNELPEGELQVCYDRNDSFAAGEFFRFGVKSNLTVDKQAIVDLFSDIDHVDQLCFCQDNVGNIDCPEAPEPDACEDVNCGDNASCELDEDEEDGYKCVCDEGYEWGEGDDADKCVAIVVTACTDVTCGDNESCVLDEDEVDGYKCICDEGFVAEGVEGACIDTKEVPCATAAPLNGADTVADVTVSYVKTGEVWGWENPAACAWTCNTDYDKYEETCINKKDVPCDQTDVTVPADATIVVEDVEVEYTTADGWADPVKCAWACNDGYTLNDEEDGCEVPPTP